MPVEGSRMEFKRSLVFLAVLVFCAQAAAAQTKKFDIVTYSAPAGWAAETNASSITFTKGTDTQFTSMSLTRSTDGVGSSSENFEALWQGMAVEGLRAVADPQRGPTGEKDGWQTEVGTGAFEKDGLKGVALLATFTGNGKVVALLAITNSEDELDAIDAFIKSLKLPKIAPTKAAPASPAAATSAEPSGDSAKLIGRWQRSSGGSPSYADPASWGTSGYTKSRYEFNADGTYNYTERSFRYSYENIIIVRESGRYTIGGNTLTIKPAKSTISAYRKAGGGDTLGGVVSTQNRRLETVSYRFTFHYFSGIQEWNLVLQADSPTERDGAFSTLKVFDNAWYFDQKYISGDLTSARGT
jgi:hypothetical protein